MRVELTCRPRGRPGGQQVHPRETAWQTRQARRQAPPPRWSAVGSGHPAVPRLALKSPLWFTVPQSYGLPAHDVDSQVPPAVSRMKR